MIRKCTQSDFQTILEIINDAAKSYKGVIPNDRWQEPYMPAEELSHEIEDDVDFWCFEKEGRLLGVMGIQDRGDVTLIRHAYVRSRSRKQGIGAALLLYLERLTEKPILVGTWKDASWAIAFYEKNGYILLSDEEKNRLLREYWSIPKRQIETSVVLANPKWAEARLGMKNKSTSIYPEGKILGIGGSPRIHGNSDVLLKHMLSGVQQADVRAEGIQLRDIHFQPCIGCEQCRKDKRCTGINDGMHLLYPKITTSQGLILLSPTHNYNVTAWMKAFIDRLYCFYKFDDQRPRGWSSRLAGQKRKAVIVAVCEHKNKKDMGFTIEAMRLPLEALGYEIIEELRVFGIFDRGAVKKDDQMLAKAFNLGRRFAISLRS